MESQGPNHLQIPNTESFVSISQRYDNVCVFSELICEGHQSDSSLLWKIQLDQDLLDTIVSIYPSWFKDVGSVLKSDGMATSSSHSSHTSSSSTTSFPSTSNIPIPPQPPLSPPKAEVDDSPLQKSMDKNKESLKVKLMLRRPITQLVAQGIMPPLKTPPAFHAQRRQLERAKTGDLLKAKIQARPARTELVRQHILLGDEGVGFVDPSLAEKQRRLSKCRLADQLNDQLAHRPGPLELIKKNILHTEEPIERAVKEGVIAFRATCEGQSSRPEPPDHYMTLDDDSRSSEATSPPSLSGEAGGVRASSPPSLSEERERGGRRASSPTSLSEERERGIVGSDMLETAAANAGIVTVMSSSTSSLSPLSSISSPPSSSSSSLSRIQQQQPAPGKDKNNHRKKSSKSKSSTPKTRTIKFHEYKGPPNAQKNASASSGAASSSTQLSSSPVETSYELLLQQQQLLWQLEWQHKYPQIILPASQKPSASPQQSSSSSTQPPPHTILPSSSPAPLPSSPSPHRSTTPASPPAPPPPPPPPLPAASPAPKPDTRPLRNLEDMKVCDLKAELKKRSLPVSGPKPQLIERLKPFTEKQLAANQPPMPPTQHATSAAISIITIPSSSSSDDTSNVSSPAQSFTQPMSLGPHDPDSPPSPPPHSPESPAPGTPQQESLSEDIIRQQQRQIDMLQRQLISSQLKLQQQQNTFQPPQASSNTTTSNLTSTNKTTVNAKANLAAFLQQQQLNQLLAQQQLIINNNNNSVNNVNNLDPSGSGGLKKAIIIGTQPATILFNHINLQKLSTSTSSTNTSTTPTRHQSLPNFLGTFVTPATHQIILPAASGALTLPAASGSVTLPASTGSLTLPAGTPLATSGSLTLGDRVLSLNGERTLSLNPTDGSLSLNPGDGRVSLNQADGNLSLNPVDGSVSLNLTDGSLSRGDFQNSDGNLNHALNIKEEARGDFSQESNPRGDFNHNLEARNLNRVDMCNIKEEGGGVDMLTGGEEFALSSADVMELLVDKPPPPQYEVATKYLKNKLAQEFQTNNPSTVKPADGGQLKVKSQLLDDIIDILIKNGDVSPSAADPNTPPTLGSKQQPPSFLSTGVTTAPTIDDEAHQIDIHSLGLDIEQYPMDLGDDVTGSSHPPGSTNEDVELMDVDTDWLEKFISDDPILSPPPPRSNGNSVLSNANSLLSNTNGVLSNDHDPLLSNNSSFWNDFLLSDTHDSNGGSGDFKMLNDHELGYGCWDRIDYAT
ncbi:hypothetical protein M8J75_014295 [Diaphorina citri]|nr:hypothetical protein M8J75_014295 [Diaphorina citri]